MEGLVKLFFQRSVENGFDWIALADIEGNQKYASGPGAFVVGLCDGSCQEPLCEPPTDQDCLNIEATVKLEGPKESTKGRHYFLAHRIDTDQPLVDVSEVPLRTSSANLFLYSRPEASFLIDCGAGPEEEDYKDAPDIEIQKFFDAASFIIVSHPHYDHYSLLAKKPAGLPVYATALAKEFIAFQARFKPEFEQVVSDTITFVPGEEIPGTGIQTFPVPHSVPEASAFYFRCGKKRVLHLGECKLNGLDYASRHALISQLEKIGKQGIDLLVFDIQNIKTEGFTISEREVLANLSELLEDTEKRVVISCFGSNIERISEIAAIARAQGRTIAFLGSGMKKAEEIVTADFPRYHADKPALIFVAGCQAEPESTLAKGQWKKYLRPGKDLTILSANAIPGNEQRVADTVANIAQEGFELVVNTGEKSRLCLESYDNIRESVVHDSGHASKADISLVLNLTHPEMIVARPRMPSLIKLLKDSTKEEIILNEKMLWL